MIRTAIHRIQATSLAFAERASIGLASTPAKALAGSGVLRAECRREERFRVGMRADILGPRGEWGRSEVLDLSWYGVRVRGKRFPLKRGRYVDLVITQGADRDQRRARVAWVTSGDGRAFEAGLEFA